MIGRKVRFEAVAPDVGELHLAERGEGVVVASEFEGGNWHFLIAGAVGQLVSRPDWCVKFLEPVPSTDVLDELARAFGWPGDPGSPHRYTFADVAEKIRFAVTEDDRKRGEIVRALRLTDDVAKHQTWDDLVMMVSGVVDVWRRASGGS